MNEHIRMTDGTAIPVRNIFCIGRNYAKHIAELGNETPAEPVVFLKPTSALLGDGGTIALPAWSDNVHFETEIVVAIGSACRNVAPADAARHIAGYAVGLDLTARDVQDALKAKGLPWTLSKGFDTSACLSAFLTPDEAGDPARLTFSLRVNGAVRQSGDASLMLHPVPALIAYLSSRFALDRGDIIYTGTPEGVARLSSGDRLAIELAGKVAAEFAVG